MMIASFDALVHSRLSPDLEPVSIPAFLEMVKTAASPESFTQIAQQIVDTVFRIQESSELSSKDLPPVNHFDKICYIVLKPIPLEEVDSEILMKAIEASVDEALEDDESPSAYDN